MNFDKVISYKLLQDEQKVLDRLNISKTRHLRKKYFI